MFKVRTERVKALSLKFEKVHQELGITVSGLKAKQNEILGAWEGESAEAFQGWFTTFLSDTEAYMRLLKNTVPSFNIVHEQLVGAARTVNQMNSSFSDQNYQTNIEEGKIMYEEGSFNTVLKEYNRIRSIYEQQIQIVNDAHNESFELSDDGLSDELLSLKRVFSKSQENCEDYIYHAGNYQKRIEEVRSSIETLFNDESKEYVAKGIDFSEAYHENIIVLNMFRRVFNFKDMSVTEEGFKYLEELLKKVNDEEISENELLGLLEILGEIDENDLFKLIDKGVDTMEGFATLYAQFFFYVNQMVPTIKKTTDGFVSFSNNLGYNLSGGPRRMKLESLIKNYPKIYRKYTQLEKLGKLSKILDKISTALIIAETTFKIAGDVAYDVENEMNPIVIGGNTALNIGGGFAKYGALKVIGWGGGVLTGMALVFIGGVTAPAWVISSVIAIGTVATIFVGWAVCEIIDFIVDGAQDFLRDCNEFINEAIDGVGNFVSDVVDGVSNFIGDVGKGIGDFFGI